MLETTRRALLGAGAAILASPADAQAPQGGFERQAQRATEFSHMQGPVKTAHMAKCFASGLEIGGAHDRLS